MRLTPKNGSLFRLLMLLTPLLLSPPPAGGGLQKLSRGKFRPVRLPSSVNGICEDKRRGVTWIACDDGLRCHADNLVPQKVRELAIRYRN